MMFVVCSLWFFVCRLSFIVFRLQMRVSPMRVLSGVEGAHTHARRRSGMLRCNVSLQDP